jgi:hypothetical protein
MVLRKLLACVAVLACGVLTLASADDKKDDKGKPALTGSWVLAGGEPKIEFADKDVMKVYPHGDSVEIVILCSYAVEKDGRVTAKITDFEGKEEIKDKAKASLPPGLTFSFKWQVKGDTATLDDLKGDKTDLIKTHLEGKYEKK